MAISVALANAHRDVRCSCWLASHNALGVAGGSASGHAHATHTACNTLYYVVRIQASCARGAVARIAWQGQIWRHCEASCGL